MGKCFSSLFKRKDKKYIADQKQKANQENLNSTHYKQVNSKTNTQQNSPPNRMLEIILITNDMHQPRQDNQRQQQDGTISLDGKKIEFSIKKPSQSEEVQDINDQNLDEIIDKASQLENSTYARKLWQKIIKFISQMEETKFQSIQKLAYAEANLADLYAQINPSQYKIHYQRAVSIYGQYQNEYYEEIVTILNNWALKDESLKLFDIAIEKYTKILEIQDKYYEINDERKLLSQNNLACAYCENKQFKEGQIIFEKLMQTIRQRPIQIEIGQLIEGNFKYYMPNFR